MLYTFFAIGRIVVGMKKIITYGTFDLLHQGHINLLRRAKELGDYLIVGVTSDAYDKERGKLNVHDSLIERVEAVKNTGLADEVIVEEFEGQKILDIQKYDIDTFAIGSDWEGKFDYLREYCNVVYLSRTKGISSTELRNAKHRIVRIGIIGCGRIANRFVPEAHLVSGVEVQGVYNPHIDSAQAFAAKHELGFASDVLGDFLSHIDAVYIASPHGTHFEYIMASLNAGKHVLCEKPFVLSSEEVMQAYAAAREKGLALLQGIKTAFCPAFEHMVVLGKSGRIGRIVDIDASFTKLVSPDVREMKPGGEGGSMLELASYPLLAIAKLLGIHPVSSRFFPSLNSDDVDIFTRGLLEYETGTGSFKVGLGAKTEGSLIVTGTAGYIYVPAPWWKTDYFEMRFENLNDTRKFFYAFDGEGLRYEITEFVRMIHSGLVESPKLTEADTLFMTKMIERFRAQVGCS